MSEITASPFSSKVTRHERKLVPPASITITDLLVIAFSGGRHHVVIISSSDFSLRRPRFISSRIDSARTLTSTCLTKLCRERNALTAEFIVKNS